MSGEVEVTVGRRKTRRSDKQNRLLWAYYEIISNETGQGSAEEIHEYMKRKFLPPVIIKTKWGEMKVPGSTTKLSSIEFGNYLDRINALVQIPIPVLEI